MSRQAVRTAIERALTILARLVTGAWFRGVETQNLDRISADHPVIICANHPNGFVDPVLVVATSPRVPQLLAKATLWRVPGIGPLLDAAGVIPVRRREDGTAGGNVRSFEAAEDALRHDGVIALFPEGTVNDTAQLKPLKTGAARIALGARARGARGLRIVPVGLVYEQKSRPRARALVRAGTPIDLDTVVPTLVTTGEDQSEENHELVDALTELIAQRLRDASLDYEDAERGRALIEVAAVYLRDPEADPAKRVALAGIESTGRRLDRAPAEARDRVLQAFDEYQHALQVVSLRDPDIVPGNTPDRLQEHLATSTTKVALLTPFAAVGAVLNVVPYQAVRFVWRRPVARISKANNTILAGLVVFPLTWLAWSLLARRKGARRPLALGFGGGLAGGFAAVAWWEQVAHFRESRSQWHRLARSQDLIAELQTKRDAVVEAVSTALAAHAEEAAAS